MFDESYNILNDLLGMCSVIYQKGAVDANKYCDMAEMRDFANRAETEHYTTLMLIVNNQIRTLDERQFLNIMRTSASENRYFAYRNFSMNGKPQLISATCSLLDYCYRLGVAKTMAFDRSRLHYIKSIIKPSAAKFFSPSGFVEWRAWLDTVRGYITEIELDSNEDVSRNMVMLDEFIAMTIRTRNEAEEIESIENERRKFILSGGDI